MINEYEQKIETDSSSGDEYSADEAQFRRSANQMAKSQAVVDRRMINLLKIKRKVLIAHGRQAPCSDMETYESNHYKGGGMGSEVQKQVLEAAGELSLN